MFFTLAAAPASASTFIDAHGNEVELDDSLEAYTEADLIGANDAARKHETNLGDLWTDALRWFVVSGKVNEYYEEDDVTAGNNQLAVDADHVVALWNGGNLRADIPAGKFGAAELAEVLPFPNTVAIVYMTGAQLREALEAATQALPYSEATAAACASFMQVSGMKYTVDISKPFDQGEVYKAPWYKAASVSRVTITEVGGKAFDEAATYAVVTSNANFNGMDSSYLFKAAAAADDRCVITTAVVRDAVWTYLDEELENIVREETYGKAQGRIKLLFTDAHGNVVELDDSVEALTTVKLVGADDAARKGETNLGDLWTDALRWFAASGAINAYFEEDDLTAGNDKLAVDADHIVALWNGGNLRADIDAGSFGAAELAEVLPYPNKVAVVYMTGAQLREALEAASQAIPYSESTAAACASFMQVSGMKYTVDASRPFAQGEVYKEPWYKAASVGRVIITEVCGKAFDETATYAVVTSNANFNGMDSSYIFKEAAAANDKSAITTAVVRDVVWLYLKETLAGAVGDSYAAPQGRITIAGKPAVVPTKQNLTVNGEAKTAEIYNIDGSNYFKLRDVASLLSGTGSQFSVGYDAASNTISIQTGEAYEKQPGDLEPGDDKSASAVRSAQKLVINGEPVTDLTAFNLGGYNFFRLRELGEKLGFGVTFDEAANTVVVTSK
jgi:2',3'-cyclic-nucleotide 2'-phosphodiesterase (5'-nucleotidase family)